MSLSGPASETYLHMSAYILRISQPSSVSSSKLGKTFRTLSQYVTISFTIFTLKIEGNDRDFIFKAATLESSTDWITELHKHIGTSEGFL